jgi:hypothetical protein
MTPTKIIALPKEKFAQFNIPKGAQAFSYFLEKSIEERCDELDYQLEDEGFEIVHRDLNPVATNIYNYEVIVFK